MKNTIIVTVHHEVGDGLIGASDELAKALQSATQDAIDTTAGASAKLHSFRVETARHDLEELKKLRIQLSVLEKKHGLSEEEKQ